jgi:intracellular septation protein
MLENDGKMDKRLRLALDFGPLLGFFLGFRAYGLLAGTAALIALTLLSLAIIYAVEKRMALMPLLSGMAVTVFGGLTLFLHDERFIKIKPTLINLLFAAILLIGLYYKKPMMKFLLQDAFRMTDEGWKKLSFRWGLFFIFLAALNECIWRNFPTEFWVSFKVFGMLTLTMAFTLSQIPLIKKYWVEEPSSDESRPQP